MPAASPIDCVFCDIVRGENTHHIIYEDAEYLGFLDKYPLNPGHTQLIPKEHYRWVWDLDNAEVGFLFMRARRIARALQKVFNTEWVIADTGG
ncbi:MAG TPA: HIT domain-containing protein, partial [Candidatus Kapabacteria bacterium]|nr:HIT domain-containing protein [Candidatus Kapabacteria bacterium]